MEKRKSHHLYFILFLVALINCNTTEPLPPGEKPTLTLKLEDASCTEAWIELTVNNSQLPITVTLLQNGEARKTIDVETKDYLLYIDSLLPNTNYNFSVSHSGLSGISSNELTVTTLDTTSHDFTFETYTFGGQAGSCALYDVAIIDENNIWAVGEIYLLDSLGQPDPKRYNLAVWDGNDWEIKRVPYYYQGQPLYHPIQSIFAFSINDIWFCGNGIIHWDGTQYNPISIPPTVWGPYQMNKIWGTSSNDLYVVGNKGSIGHYQNGVWSRIESGTNVNINDIWGDYNKETDKWEILAVASNYPESLDKEILSIKNNSVTDISTSPITWPLFTIWFVPGSQYYVAGSGIYQKHLLQDSLWKNKVLEITAYTTTSIRGNGINDVIGVGAFGDFIHYNGVNWKTGYEEPKLSNGSYAKVAVKGDIIVAVGSNQISINSEAVILVGRR